MFSYAPPAVGEPAVLDTFERTASDEIRALVGNLRKAYEDSRSRSRVRDLLDRLDSLNTLLNRLYLVPNDWNGYGSPAPSKDSIEISRKVLNSLWPESILPDKVLPSADGGVALIFRTDTDNRAVAETLNDHETYLLLYDRQGNSRTLTWREAASERQGVILQLREHLRGTPLAAL
ncbi:MAG TPA: hypothetical protein VMD25_00450 [Acidobacteriaceae bacterium]|nr:hypothetical protein [Acidobacteriaceae bacterium]